MLVCDTPGKHVGTRRGTSAGYAAHRRLGEEPCEDCRQGHSRDSYQRRKYPRQSDEEIYAEWLHIRTDGGDITDWARRIGTSPKRLLRVLHTNGYTGVGYPIPGPGRAVVRGIMHWPDERFR